MPATESLTRSIPPEWDDPRKLNALRPFRAFDRCGRFGHSVAACRKAARRGRAGPRRTSLSTKPSSIEIERETASDLLSPQEAETARTEAARRLLRAADETAAPGKARVPAGAAQFRLRLVAVLALLLVPALSLGLYAVLGHPAWPDEPLAARLDVPTKNMKSRRCDCQSGAASLAPSRRWTRL